jgi:hypothetical protein
MRAHEHSLKKLLIERVWIFAAGICLICAVVFLARENMSAAFVAATLGVVAWFINVRNQLKRTIIPADDELDDEASDDERDNERDDESDHKSDDESDEITDADER